MGTVDIDLSLDENRHIKPQYSYAQMITQAILNTEDEKLNLNGIYNFIMDRYSYYRYQTASGWQVCLMVFSPPATPKLTYLAEFNSSQPLTQQGL